MKKCKNEYGFTLAELLIAVAIIAVLVAIGIPIFTIQLEKSREATDLANVRAAYSQIMTAAMTEDKSPGGEITFMHDRWYTQVDLKQREADWQSSGPFTVGNVTSTDGVRWVGTPAPGGYCLISYAPEYGAVLAWEYDFAYITNKITINQGNYKGQTVTQLLHASSFSMLESSGTTGQYITSEIKHQLGMKKADNFSYKILKAPEYGENYYQIYLSDSYTLKTKLTPNQSNVGSITVTGYIYKIGPDGASTLVKRGTTQTLSTYTNKDGQEKIDVNGNQDNCSTIPKKANNVAYKWD